MRAVAMLLAIAVLLFAASTLLAQTSTQPGDLAHGAEKASAEQAHPEEHEQEKPEPTYFGMPGWILKLFNLVLFIGILVWLMKGPVGTAFRERSVAIRRTAEEAQARREQADRMMREIEARLGQIENELRAIHERAEQDGERQKRELIAAAEAESEKILNSAKTEVENRLKRARQELTEYAGELATDRAEAILKTSITDADRQKLFAESVKQVEEAHS